MHNINGRVQETNLVWACDVVSFALVVAPGEIQVCSWVTDFTCLGPNLFVRRVYLKQGRGR